MSTIKRALWGLALALVAATLIANAYMSLRSAQQLAAGAAASTKSREVINAIDDVLTVVVDAETGQRGYLLTQRVDYLAPYSEALHGAYERIGELKAKLADNPQQLTRLVRLQPLIEQKLEELRHTVDLQESGHHDEAMKLVANDEGMRLMTAIRADIDAMRQAEEALQEQRDQQAQHIYSLGQFNRILGMVVGLILVLLAYALLARDLAARARGEKDLYLQHEWLSTTLRSIGDGVIVTDTQGRVQMLNPVAEQLTGWSETEAAGRPLREVLDIIDEISRQPSQDPVQRALREGKPVGLANHTVLRSRGGQEYVISDSAAPTRDREGIVRGAVMVFHDSSDRRRAEIALSMASEEVARRAGEALVAERSLNTVLQNAPIGICMTGPAPDFPVVVISRQMQEWIGTVQPGTPALAAYKKLLPDGREPPPDLIPLNRVMHSGQSVRDEPWLIERKGDTPLTVIVNVAPVRDADGAIIGAVHSWVDLTERQLLDMELRATQSRLRVLVESNVIGLILSFDGDGNVIQANRAFLDMLGFDANDVASAKVNLLKQTPPESVAGDRRAFDEVADVGFCAPYEKEFLHSDGRRVAAVVGYARVADANNEFVGFALDISERKELERRLHERTEDLLTAAKRKDEFLAMLAHELRNPLAPLRNVVHLLDSARAAEPRFVENLLPMMRRQIDHLVRLVDDLLDAARISQGKITIEHKIVEIMPSLRAAIESIEGQIKARGHTLSLDFTREALYVDGDATRLTQMFSNILHNAAKYTQNDGRIEMILARDGEQALITVRDNGQGISAQLLPRIFETFIQDDQSLARSAGGLGVGLALVRKLADLHGGSVCARSAGSGLGSEFELRLPLAAAASISVQPLPAQATIRGGIAQRVLVVDDNADVATSLAALLDLWGHEVRVVNDGHAAIAVALDFRPSVVLLDIGLPGLDGFEIARRMRATPELKDMRLIAITGYGQLHDRARARDVGFDAHLIKPVQPETLSAMLDEANA